MMSVMKPMPAATTAPMPFLWNFSRIKPSSTAPQPMHIADEGGEGGLVEFLPGLLPLRGGNPGGNHLLERGEFRRPVRRVGRLHGIAQLRVKRQPLVHLGDGIFVGGAARGLFFLDALVFLVEGRQRRLKLVP